MHLICLFSSCLIFRLFLRLLRISLRELVFDILLDVLLFSISSLCFVGWCCFCSFNLFLLLLFYFLSLFFKIRRERVQRSLCTVQVLCFFCRFRFFIVSFEQLLQVHIFGSLFWGFTFQKIIKILLGLLVHLLLCFIRHFLGLCFSFLLSSHHILYNLLLLFRQSFLWAH